jgi:hypothetical protein
MSSVFIGGSRRISRMNGELARRFDNIIQKQLRVLIGDANGFDRLAQTYLSGHHYPSVVIYCTNGICRNNIGNWPVHVVEYHGRDRGLEFYTAKDDAMLQDADFGLFGWDGKSKGTLRNVRIMAQRGKPSAVYVAPVKKFVTVRHAQDVSSLSPEMNALPAQGEDLFSETQPSESPIADPTTIRVA